jgi:hypothetical protein
MMYFSGLFINWVHQPSHFMKQLAAVLTIFVFTACDGNKADADYTPTQSVVIADTQTQKPKDGLEQLLGPNATKPQSVPGADPTASQQHPTAAAVPVAAPASTANTGALNPAHGQPGHRCEIAVGAPLSTAPAAPTATAAQPTAQPITVKQNAPIMVPTAATPSPLNKLGAKGMNPAHGQPGHRCDIAVGAPLNSKPTAQPTEAKPVTATPTIQPNIAQQPQPVAAAAPTAPGMNPAHGQPGHRCDIAVGAPLNSKPTAKKDSAR